MDARDARECLQAFMTKRVHYISCLHRLTKAKDTNSSAFTTTKGSRYSQVPNEGVVDFQLRDVIVARIHWCFDYFKLTPQ
jgi:hypothetical protein